MLLSRKRYELLEKQPNTQQRIIFFIGVLAVWWFVSYFSFVNTLLLPSPMEVVSAAKNIGFPLIQHIIATTIRALIGLVLGVVFGVILGLLTRYSAIVKVCMEPFLDAARPVPAIAMLPFFILIFGFSEVGRIILVLIAVIVIVSVATVEATETIPETWLRFPLVAGFSRKKIFLKVIFPGLIPWLIGPVRIALSLSFTLVIASEFMGAQEGLGYLINISRVNLATPTILLCIFLLGVVAQMLDMLIYVIMSKMCFWYQGTRKALK